MDYNHIYVFNSKDFDFSQVFKKYLANRGGREDALEKHIQAIKDTIVKQGGMDRFPPITVDINTYKIVDGNCRFNAVMDIIRNKLLDQIELSVIFEDVPEDDFDNLVIDLNMNQKSWGILDIVYNYSMRGIPSFQMLIDFCDRNETLHSSDGKKINPRYGIAALGKPVNMLKSPNFSITEEEIERGNEIVYEANQIRMKFSHDIKANGGGWYEPYLRAWAEFRMSDGLREITFKKYLSEVNETIRSRKSKVKVPYGSNKKGDWNTFFRAILTYC